MRLDKAGTAVSPPHSEPLCLAKLIASWLQTIISQQISGWHSLRLPRRTRHRRKELQPPVQFAGMLLFVVYKMREAAQGCLQPWQHQMPVKPGRKKSSVHRGWESFFTPRLHDCSHPWPGFRRGRHQSIKAASKKKKEAKGRFLK